MGRLVQLQVLKKNEFAQLAIQRQQVTRAISAPRGVIYDGHMDELATSVPVKTVVAEPRMIADVPAAVRKLAPVLGIGVGELEKKLTDPERQTFQVLKRRIDPKTESRVEGLGIAGVYLTEESMRVYPNRSLASHVLGFVNMNGDGGAGIELQYNKDLKGQDGLLTSAVDARRISFRTETLREPVQGNSLVLSIDKSIQYTVERELAAAVEAYKAASGTAIVMECDTGRILAMALCPDFNPNSYNEYPIEFHRNRAVTDSFEPGSTFKVVVAASALEAGLTRPAELIDCQMGSIVIGGHVFHDHKPYGLLTFSQVLEHSSNVGASILGLRLGKERLYDGLRSFGFGSETGIDLPGEVNGLVREWHQWSGLSIGAISFGQEVGVTSVQILTAINAIANGGFLVRPSVVDRVISEKGDLARKRDAVRKRIISDKTAAAVRDAFEGVVSRGTGKRAALEGYRAAGKTGTAQMIVGGHYSANRYIASFIGFTPLPNPKITVMVRIDEPHGAIYGGEVSAPTFKKVAQEALLQLRVPPDPALPMPKFNPALASAEIVDFAPNATPVMPLSAVGGGPATASEPTVIRTYVGAGAISVPDFTGMPKRTVAEKCRELGLRPQFSGSGIAVVQVPPPGTVVSAGEACEVTFARGRLMGRDGSGAGRIAQGSTRTASSPAALRP
jgi:cell division protein FtsI (penicillin-binding protein 3)